MNMKILSVVTPPSIYQNPSLSSSSLGGEVGPPIPYAETAAVLITIFTAHPNIIPNKTLHP